MLSNSMWPNAAFISAALLGATFIGTLLATRYRSRRILLISQVAMMVLYSAFLVIVCGVVLQPTAVESKVGEQGRTAGGRAGFVDCMVVCLSWEFGMLKRVGVGWAQVGRGER